MQSLKTYCKTEELERGIHKSNYADPFDQIKNQSTIQNKYRQEKNSFNYGHEGTKIANYVLNQFKKDQSNKETIQKFRKEAIKYRSQKYSKNLGTQPYITDSMLPGIAIDSSKYAQNSVPFELKPKPIVSFHEEKDQRKLKDLHNLKERQMSKKEKKKYKQIGRMINQINYSLKKNTKALEKSFKNSQDFLKNKFYEIPPASEKRRKYFTEGKERYLLQRYPTISYNNDQYEEDSYMHMDKKKLSLNAYLKCMKKNRKRLDELTQQ